MSKVYEIELGGKTRRLTYDWASARPFFKKYGAKPYRFLFQDCAGFVLDAKGNMTFDEVDGQKTAIMSSDVVDDDKRRDLLVLGLHSTPEDVDKWIVEYLKAGNALPDIVWIAVKAALYAGVTGKSVDLDAVGETTEGKAPETQEAQTTG